MLISGDLMLTCGLVIAALVLDGLFGDPDWAWRRATHPVALMGRLIAAADRGLNRDQDTFARRRWLGVLAIVVLVGAAAAVGVLLHYVVRSFPGGTGGGAVAFFVEAVLVAILIAQRSLYEHVDRVRRAFAEGGIEAAQQAVAMIVGRDPRTLDEAAICRASIESAAENFSDGVVAPVFWYGLLGLPGIFAYKMLNTADSMIGHRSAKYRAFGWTAARMDDIANVFPARIAALFIAAASPSGTRRALRVVIRDAAKHRSPNAGWPEAAMAGTLDVALAGPRVYAEGTVDDPWLNETGRRQATPQDIGRALAMLFGACVVQGLAIAGLAGAVWWFG